MRNLKYGDLFIASGTFGSDGLGEGINPYLISNITGVVLKTGTPYARIGNTGQRLQFLNNGMINNVGLKNPGINNILENSLPFWSKVTNVVISIYSDTLPGWSLLGRTLEKYSDLFAVELNISCPNLDRDWLPLDAIDRFTAEYHNPIWVKFAPQSMMLESQVKEYEKYDIDAFTISNSWYTKEYDLIGGLSGPIIKESNLELVENIVKMTDIPIIGCGGISREVDAYEYLKKGAIAIQVGSINILDPYAACKIAYKLDNLLSSRT